MTLSPILAQAEKAAPAQELGYEFWIYFGIAVLALALVVMAVILLSYGTLWFQAYMSCADVSLWSLIGMDMRRVRKQLIVDAKITAAQAGLDINRQNGITTRRLEEHFLAGGDVHRVIRAIIAAHRAHIDLDFDRAAAIDLAGRDVMDAVQTSVHPKVIDCPDPRRSGKSTLS